jgi:SAM-dependent methyltransferase
MNNHKKIFTNIYKKNFWGNNENLFYKGSSGGGKFLEQNQKEYVNFLKKFISSKKIKNIVDLGCGDFRLGTILYDELNVTYIGFDVYEELINYLSKNFTNKKYNFYTKNFLHEVKTIPDADLYIIKDVIQHWNNAEIIGFLDYLVRNKKYKYILICNCCFDSKINNINTGQFRPICCCDSVLLKYNAINVFNYKTKQVCVIKNKYVKFI